MSSRRSHCVSGWLECEALEDRVVPAVFAPLASAVDGAADSLRAAIIAANINPDTVNTINLETGTYTLSVANTAGEENAAATGDLDLANLASGATPPASKTYILQGAGAKDTIIDAAQVDRVFHVLGANVTVEFNDLTIRNGQATTDGSAASVAGAVSALGGGVLIEGATVSFNNTSIVDNVAAGADAGTKTEARGGGVYVTGGTTTFNASTLSGNQAQGGDAATGGQAFGGGVATAHSAVINVFDSTVSGNTAVQGASSTPAAPGPNAQGGGLYVASGTTANVRNSTIADNQASAGGGVNVQSGGTLNAESSIFANNQGTFSAPDVAGNFATAQNNLVADGTGSNLAVGDPDANGNRAGDSAAPIDPLLGPLEDNGGPTQTHDLEDGSPAIDNGSLPVPVTTDQRGEPREVNGLADIGAVEYVPPPPPGLYAVGTDAGAAPHVKLFRPDNSELASFYAYDPAFTGGVHVALGDVNGDGVADVVTATATGSVHVKVIDGTKLGEVSANGEIADSALIASFFAFDPSFTGGVNLTVGKVNGDNHADIIVGAGAGGAPHVIVVDGASVGNVQGNGVIDQSALLGSFFAYVPAFAGGVNVAAADVDGDGRADVVTATGPGSAPHIKVINGTQLGNIQADGQIANSALLASFFAFTPEFTGGINVAAGDVDGDGHAEIIFSAMSGGATLNVADGTRLTQTSGGILSGSALRSSTFPLGTLITNGLQIGTVDANQDGRADVIVAPGRGTLTRIRVYNGLGLDAIPRGGDPAAALLDSFLAFDRFGGGLFVGGM